MRYIIIDHYVPYVSEIESADSIDVIANNYRKDDLAKCLSPKLVKLEEPYGSVSKEVEGVVSFMDEASVEGWGEGCKFEGQNPDCQVMFSIIPRKTVSRLSI
jgi:hypothetical protein